MLNYSFKLSIVIILGCVLTSCKLVSRPGYSDDFVERSAQVHEDEQNPAGKEKRKLLYIHGNDTCSELETFYYDDDVARYREKAEVVSTLAKEKRCLGLVNRIKMDRLIIQQSCGKKLP